MTEPHPVHEPPYRAVVSDARPILPEPRQLAGTREVARLTASKPDLALAVS